MAILGKEGKLLRKERVTSGRGEEKVLPSLHRKKIFPSMCSLAWLTLNQDAHLWVNLRQA